MTVFNGESEAEVACGAPNVAEGQVIAYAGIGAVLVDPYSDKPGATHKLKKSKIRGVESHGMVCSEKEAARHPSRRAITWIIFVCR